MKYAFDMAVHLADSLAAIITVVGIILIKINGKAKQQK